jgi:hypothetical protein
VGLVDYDSDAHTLTLVNRCVGLARNVLLLGHSKKASHVDVIGEFGEGMKIGALGLLREGREVQMETAHDRWVWDRAMCPAFGERVLTVFVHPRDGQPAAATGVASSALELAQEDTRTVIHPISPDEWQKYSGRFLFLHPPTLHFRAPEIGRLLLDDDLAGQL